MFNPGKTNAVGIKYLRNICLAFDSFIYMILTLLFKVFFNLTSADFLNNEIMTNFYNNIQLLLGIYITFNLCFSFFAYLVNPDKLSDNKVGASKLITRIVIALLMLTLLLPLSGIPDSDAPEKSYNLAIKQKGILFGTLQIVQDRIIEQNVIGALVLGNNTNRINSTYEAQADMVVGDILKAFIFKYTNDCENDTFQNYDLTSDYTTIIDYASSETCNNDSKKYAYSYIFLGSWICGVILIFVVAGFCVDVAIRLIKLSILRLIAPIPIISYINPNSKNDSFNSWVKMVTSTYLDLFIRIGTIYLVVYICSTLLGNDVLVFSSNNFWINLLSRILIYIGLFLFAKQAPKFLMDMLGIKSDGKGFFSGIGAIAGFGAAAGGLAGGIIGTGVRYGRQSYKESMENNPNQKKIEKLGNTLKAFGAGLVGAGTGGIVAANASAHAKDHRFSAGMNAARQRALVRETGSTFGGRAKQSFADLLGFDANTTDNMRIAVNDDFIDAFKFVDNQLDNDRDKIDYTGVNKNGTNALGKSLNNTSIKEQIKVLEAMRASGQYKSDQITFQEDLITDMKKQRYATRSADIKDVIYADVERMRADARKNSYKVNVNDYDSVKGVRYKADDNTHAIKTSKRYVAAQKFKEVNKR